MPTDSKEDARRARGRRRGSANRLACGESGGRRCTVALVRGKDVRLGHAGAEQQSRGFRSGRYDHPTDEWQPVSEGLVRLGTLCGGSVVRKSQDLLRDSYAIVLFMNQASPFSDLSADFRRKIPFVCRRVNVSLHVFACFEFDEIRRRVLAAGGCYASLRARVVYANTHLISPSLHSLAYWPAPPSFLASLLLQFVWGGTSHYYAVQKDTVFLQVEQGGLGLLNPVDLDHANSLAFLDSIYMATPSLYLDLALASRNRTLRPQQPDSSSPSSSSPAWSPWSIFRASKTRIKSHLWSRTLSALRSSPLAVSLYGLGPAPTASFLSLPPSLFSPRTHQGQNHRSTVPPSSHHQQLPTRTLHTLSPDLAPSLLIRSPRRSARLASVCGCSPSSALLSSPRRPCWNPHPSPYSSGPASYRLLLPRPPSRLLRLRRSPRSRRPPHSRRTTPTTRAALAPSRPTGDVHSTLALASSSTGNSAGGRHALEDSTGRTYDCRRQLQIAEDDCCIFCGLCDSLIHALFDCDFSSSYWSALVSLLAHSINDYMTTTTLAPDELLLGLPTLSAVTDVSSSPLLRAIVAIGFQNARRHSLGSHSADKPHSDVAVRRYAGKSRLRSHRRPPRVGFLSDPGGSFALLSPSLSSSRYSLSGLSVLRL
ncbi:RHTO0S01e08746g1_1 [Rhodotorula toruloides]|uniref:RHTO0S01e08746g1_1 n=1 Tax=Rhodotorula toruloides TaxID=5286 RepID=A0A061AE61_RHOTO|nr:RHTO0S01e08746g1_1 [Rhodotorula toruloides]